MQYLDLTNMASLKQAFASANHHAAATLIEGSSNASNTFQSSLLDEQCRLVRIFDNDERRKQIKVASDTLHTKAVELGVKSPDNKNNAMRDFIRGALALVDCAAVAAGTVSCCREAASEKAAE